MEQNGTVAQTEKLADEAMQMIRQKRHELMDGGPDSDLNFTLKLYDDGKLEWLPHFGKPSRGMDSYEIDLITLEGRDWSHPDEFDDVESCGDPGCMVWDDELEEYGDVCDCCRYAIHDSIAADLDNWDEEVRVSIVEEVIEWVHTLEARCLNN